MYIYREHRNIGSMHGRHERWRGRLVVLQWVVSQLEGLMTFVGGCVCETWSWKNCSWFIVRYLRNMDLIASCSFLGPSQPTLPQLPSHYSLHLISQILTQIYMGYRIYQLMDAPTLKNENLAGSWISFILGHPSRKAREHPWFQSACYKSCELGFQLVFIISCWHSISIIAPETASSSWTLFKHLWPLMIWYSFVYICYGEWPNFSEMISFNYLSTLHGLLQTSQILKRKKKC